MAICNDISLFANCYGVIGLFVRLAVSILLRHTVDYVFKAVFRLLCHLVRSSVFDSFFVAQLCKTLNFLELGCVCE